MLIQYADILVEENIQQSYGREMHDVKHKPPDQIMSQSGSTDCLLKAINTVLDSFYMQTNE